MDITVAERSDIPGILGISRKELGEDFFDEDDMMMFIDRKGIIVAKDDEVLGFVILMRLDRNGIDRELRLPNGKDRDTLLEYGTVGFIDAIAVRSKGEGIGSRLFRYALDSLSDTDAVVLMAQEQPSGKMNIQPLAEKHGFVIRESVPMYWNQFVDSPEGHHCPMCGPPCRCSGRLFLKDQSQFSN